MSGVKQHTPVHTQNHTHTHVYTQGLSDNHFLEHASLLGPILWCGWSMGDLRRRIRWREMSCSWTERLKKTAFQKKKKKLSLRSKKKSPWCPVCAGAFQNRRNILLQQQDEHNRRANNSILKLLHHWRDNSGFQSHVSSELAVEMGREIGVEATSAIIKPFSRQLPARQQGNEQGSAEALTLQGASRLPPPPRLNKGFSRDSTSTAFVLLSYGRAGKKINKNTASHLITSMVYRKIKLKQGKPLTLTWGWGRFLNS